MRTTLIPLFLAAGVLACGGGPPGPRTATDSLLAGTWTADSAGVHITLGLDAAACTFQGGYFGSTPCKSLGKGSYELAATDTGSFTVDANYELPGVFPLPGVSVHFVASHGGTPDAEAVLRGSMPDSSTLVGELVPVIPSKLGYVFGSDSGLTLTFRRH